MANYATGKARASQKRKSSARTTAATKRRTTKTMRAGTGNKSKNRATARGR